MGRFAEPDVFLVGHDQCEGVKLRIDPMAGPRVVTGMPHHTGAHRIELDIALALEQVESVADDRLSGLSPKSSSVDFDQT